MVTKGEYQEFLRSDHWKALRASKKKKAQCCGCHHSGANHLHHILYRDSPYETTKKDVMWLCADCHKLFHELFGVSVAKFFLSKKGKPNRVLIRAFTKYSLRVANWERGIIRTNMKPRDFDLRKSQMERVLRLVRPTIPTAR